MPVLKTQINGLLGLVLMGGKSYDSCY